MRIVLFIFSERKTRTMFSASTMFSQNLKRMYIKWIKIHHQKFRMNRKTPIRPRFSKICFLLLVKLLQFPYTPFKSKEKQKGVINLAWFFIYLFVSDNAKRTKPIEPRFLWQLLWTKETFWMHILTFIIFEKAKNPRNANNIKK